MQAAASFVTIQAEDFNVGDELAALGQRAGHVGAVASFVGTVRAGQGDDAVHLMELEHYPGMTEQTIEAMVDAALARFDILAARVVHRVGPLKPQAQIVFVGVAASHRKPAFEACEFLVDYLKTQAPFWKKEHTAHGARWVDARAADDDALQRWGLRSDNATRSP